MQGLYCTISHVGHKVVCSVHVNRGTEHMLACGQRIATRTGVEPSSGRYLHGYGKPKGS